MNGGRQGGRERGWEAGRQQAGTDGRTGGDSVHVQLVHHIKTSFQQNITIVVSAYHL